MRDYFDAGDQYCLRFAEKGGKSREIPVRHDLQQFLSGFVAAAGISSLPADSPLFRSAIRRTGRLTDSGMTADDMSRMVKRRMREAGLLRIGKEITVAFSSPSPYPLPPWERGHRTVISLPILNCELQRGRGRESFSGGRLAMWLLAGRKRLPTPFCRP